VCIGSRVGRAQLDRRPDPVSRCAVRRGRRALRRPATRIKHLSRAGCYGTKVPGAEAAATWVATTAGRRRRHPPSSSETDQKSNRVESRCRTCRPHRPQRADRRVPGTSASIPRGAAARSVRHHRAACAGSVLCEPRERPSGVRPDAPPRWLVMVSNRIRSGGGPCPPSFCDIERTSPGRTGRAIPPHLACTPRRKQWRPAGLEPATSWCVAVNSSLTRRNLRADRHSQGPPPGPKRKSDPASQAVSSKEALTAAGTSTMTNRSAAKR
jgi:hypothetical protein